MREHMTDPDRPRVDWPLWIGWTTYIVLLVALAYFCLRA